MTPLVESDKANHMPQAVSLSMLFSSKQRAATAEVLERGCKRKLENFWEKQEQMADVLCQGVAALVGASFHRQSLARRVSSVRHDSSLREGGSQE